MKGYIHSIETMGLVDGPGIRVVVFLSGCALRCAYCHNPDTWKLKEGKLISSEELIRRILRYKSYFKFSGGGVTFSGGEPLLQVEFLKEMLKLCRENGIHTAIDTAGCGIGGYEDILSNVDLVIFDIKHLNPEGYKELTGHSIDESEKFLEAVQRKGNKLWIRQVVTPGINDNDHYMEALAKKISTLKNVEKLELLPYHRLGVNKYEALSMNYKLAEVEEMDKSKVKAWEEWIIEYIKKNKA